MLPFINGDNKIPENRIETKAVNGRARILLLVKSLGLGGAERLLVDAIPYLDRRQFEYHLAYLLPWKEQLVPHFEQAGIPVHCLGRDDRNHEKGRPAPQSPDYSRRAGAGLYLQALHRLWALHRGQRFDLIHADLPLTGIMARVFGRYQNIPVLYTEHNLQERYHVLTAWANRATYAWNHCVLAVSDEVAGSIRRANMDRKTQVETLLNGVPVEQVRAEAVELGRLRAELEIPEHHVVIGAVAVFRRQKRLLDWLTVAAQVTDQRPDVTFLLAGDGPEMDSVRCRIAQLGLEERVRLPGFRPDGRRLIGLMDIYLMTSEFEGLPIALLEAMALAKPIVATNVGGIPEAVEHGRQGLLTDVGAIDELVHFVGQLLGSPDMRQEMGRLAVRKVETSFHTSSRVCRIETLYLKALQRGSPLGIEPAQTTPRLPSRFRL